MATPTSGEEHGKQEQQVLPKSGAGVQARSRGAVRLEQGRAPADSVLRTRTLTLRWEPLAGQSRADISDLVSTGCRGQLRIDEGGFVPRTGSVPGRAWGGDAACTCGDRLCGSSRCLITPGSLSPGNPILPHTQDRNRLLLEAPPAGVQATGAAHFLRSVPTMQCALRKAPHPPSASVSPSV